MQQWPQQAPLLHGAEVQPGQTAQRDTESSSGSLTQEQVLMEVRRQVQLAMGARQQELRPLQDENHSLRTVVEAQQRGMEQMEATLQPNLRGGNPTEAQGGHVPGTGHGSDLHAGPPRDPGVPEGNVARVCEVSIVPCPPQGLRGDDQGEHVGDRGPEPTCGDG